MTFPASTKKTEPRCRGSVLGIILLCPVELLLPLPAPRTLPVVGQVLEGHAIVLGGVIDVAADGADILAGGLLLAEIHLGQDGRHEVGKSFQLGGVHLVGIDIDFRIGEAFQLAAVVGVLVGEQDLGHLLGFVAEGGITLICYQTTPSRVSRFQVWRPSFANLLP